MCAYVYIYMYIYKGSESHTSVALLVAPVPPQYRVLAMECGTPFRDAWTLEISQQRSTSEGKQNEDCLTRELARIAVAAIFDGTNVSLRAVRLILEKWMGTNLESQKKLIHRLVEEVVGAWHVNYGLLQSQVPSNLHSDCQPWKQQWLEGRASWGATQTWLYIVHADPR